MLLQGIECDICRHQCPQEEIITEGDKRWDKFSAGFASQTEPMAKDKDTCPGCTERVTTGLRRLLQPVQQSSTPRSRLPIASGASSVPMISIDAVEKIHILAILDALGWNKSQAAQILEIERSTLDRKLKKYGVERPRPSSE